MATQRWVGGAPAIAQVVTVTVGGTPANLQTYSVQMGLNSAKVVTYTANGADTNATIAAALQLLLAASAYPEYQEVTWTYPGTGAVITGTALTAGVPFTNTSSASGTGTLVTATTTASSGPNDVSIASNYSGNALPVNGDTLEFRDSSIGALYGLGALAAVTTLTVIVDSSYTGLIGLPQTNLSGYAEYRPAYLQLAGWASLTVGQGTGTGSGRLKFDGQSAAETTTVYSTGQPAETGVPSLLLKGSSASNVLNVLKGNVGCAFFAGEAMNLSGSLNIGYISNVTGDATVFCGAGCTLATVTKTGGKLTTNSAITTLKQYGGSTYHYAGNITTANVEGANGTGSQLYFWSGGTIATNNVTDKCTLDFSGSLAPPTLTNSNWYKGATINDPAGIMVMTNPAAIPDGTPNDITLVSGVGRHVQVT